MASGTYILISQMVEVTIIQNSSLENKMIKAHYTHIANIFSFLLQAWIQDEPEKSQRFDMCRLMGKGLITCMICVNYSKLVDAHKPQCFHFHDRRDKIYPTWGCKDEGQHVQNFTSNNGKQ